MPAPLYLRFFDHMQLYNCVYGVFRTGFRAASEESASEKTIKEGVNNLGSIVADLFGECKKQLAFAAIGQAFRTSDPTQQARMAETVLKGMLDFKPEQAVTEAKWAEWAGLTGRDYVHAILTANQARDPRIDVFADYDWARWLRPKSGCTPQTGESWNVYDAKLLSRQEVTGDNYADYILMGRCPSPTSSWPEVVYVVDGASQPDQPRMIGKFDDYYWRGVKVKVNGSEKKRILELYGPALSRRAAFCCPDEKVDVKYRWRESKFELQSRKVTPY
jgi:hypothetical protein